MFTRGNITFQNIFFNLLLNLFIYRTFTIGLTEYYQTFNELFGSGVEIKDASIEQLMIYLEKSKHKRNTNSKYKVRFNYEAIND